VKEELRSGCGRDVFAVSYSDVAVNVPEPEPSRRLDYHPFGRLTCRFSQLREPHTILKSIREFGRITYIIMVALCNRADHYILPCDFYLSSFYLSYFFSRLISAAVDWMSTILPHMVWP